METTGIELHRNESMNEPQESPGSAPSPVYLIARRFTSSLVRKLSTTDTEYVNPITLLKVHQVVILICSILLMIFLLQIPTILYYADPPTFDGNSSFTDSLDIDVNFKDCKVSIIHILWVYIFLFELKASGMTSSIIVTAPVLHCSIPSLSIECITMAVCTQLCITFMVSIISM